MSLVPMLTCRCANLAGSIHVEAVTSNDLTVHTNSGNINCLETFIGIAPPSISVVSYPPPFAHFSTSTGAISVEGVGASPAGAFAGIMGLSFQSETGNIKIEVSGGGFEGHYKASAGGALEVSVAGQEAEATGRVGYGQGTCIVHSGGDVELAMLPGPF